MSEPVWTTKDGRSIPYSELTAHHLENIERMLRDRVDRLLGCYPSFQGEMAQYYAERDWDFEWEHVHAMLEDILQEKKRRETLTWDDLIEER